MYVANTHLKPVIGIDIHFVNMPFPFVPMPHPYIGLVIDPFDYIPFIGATVKVNGVPRGNTDTAGMIITFVHIPFGVGFTIFPIIGHDSQNFFGSKKVLVDGAPMSGAGYMLMTCNDIGLPLSMRPGKKFIPIPSLYLPTSFCIPLQWGKPVMVGGPLVPNFSLMALLKAFALGSFFKIFGKLGGKLLRALNNKLLKKFPATSKLSKKLCKMGFDPVNLITGSVNYECSDFELPGPIPLRWTRNWDSDSCITGLLGHGVQLAYDRHIQLWPEEEALSLILADGRIVVFPLLQPGESYYHTAEKVLLRRKQNGHFLLEDYNDSCYYHFNNEKQTGSWSLSFIENYQGNRIQFHYTGKWLTAITDSAGRQLLLQHDTAHRIIKVAVKHGNVHQTLVRYDYNEEGDLVTITDALDQAVHIAYEQHRMVRKQDRNGQCFYWEYDAQGRCIHTWGDGGVLEGFIEYHHQYNVVTNSLGETTTYFFDENNLCIQETDHYGNHYYTEYTDDFDVYRTIDEEGHITGYVYNERGLVKEKQLPDGNSVQYNYNNYNQLTLGINPDGTTETFGYDEQRRLRFINYPNGQTVAYEYNEDGQLYSILANGNSKTLLEYDEDENLSAVHLPTGAVDRWKYDALGRCVQAINAAGQVRQYEYDAMGRIQRYYLPDGNAVRLGYNAYEEVTEATDKYGNVHFEYTPMGNMKKRTQGSSEIVFQYDTEERLRNIVNPAGRYYSIGYNKRGEIVTETGFDGLHRRFERDGTGRVVAATYPGNRTTTYEHDAIGRIVRADHHDGSWAAFGYDKIGQLTEAINEHSTIRFTRNKLGLVEQESQDGYWVKSVYDKLGNRTGMVSSLGASLSLQRNAIGLATGLKAGSGQAAWEVAFTYNTAGHEIERILPGGLIQQTQYDEAGRPAMHKLTRQHTVLQWKKYTWDADEKLTHVFDALSQAGTRFKYDTAGNLIFAQYADNRIIHRPFDASGNAYASPEKNDRQYNTAGALLRSEAYSYQYDDLGRMTSRQSRKGGGTTHFEWYADGMLKQVLRPDGKIVSFTYDALGRRLSKTFSGQVTRWVWDRDVPLHEWSYPGTEKPKAVVDEWGSIRYDQEEPVGTGLITWVFEAGRAIPCARIQGEGATSIITDYLGTPMAAYDAHGQQQWEGETDLFGRVRTLSGDKKILPFRYQGQYEDVETGLYYNRFRYYNPEEGIFLSQDPIRLIAGDLNLYTYVKDPNKYVDPSGLHTIFARFMDGSEYLGEFSSKTMPKALTEFGVNGHSEYYLLKELSTRTDLEGRTLFIKSLGNPEAGYWLHRFPLPPCKKTDGGCDKALKDFAEKHKMRIIYAHENKGKIKVNKYGPCK